MPTQMTTYTRTWGPRCTYWVDSGGDDRAPEPCHCHDPAYDHAPLAYTVCGHCGCSWAPTPIDTVSRDLEATASAMADMLEWVAVGRGLEPMALVALVAAYIEGRGWEVEE